MMERGEGGEKHCNHTWGAVLTDGLCFRIPGSGQPAELPHSAGNPPEQLSSFPAGIQLSLQGSSRHRAAAIEKQRKYNIASMKCCHPTLGSQPVILHVQSRQPVSQSRSSEPLDWQSQGSCSTKCLHWVCVLLALKGCRD